MDIKVGQIFKSTVRNNGFKIIELTELDIITEPLENNEDKFLTFNRVSYKQLIHWLQAGIIKLEYFDLKSNKYQIGDKFNFPIDAEGNQRIFTLLGVNVVTYFTDPKWQYFLASTNLNCIYMYEDVLDQWAEYKL